MARSKKNHSVVDLKLRRPWHFWVHRSVFGLMLSAAVGLWGFQVTFAGKVAPNTYVLQTDVSMQSAEQAQETFSMALAEFETSVFEIEFKDEIHLFTLNELGVRLNKTESVESIPVIQPMSSEWLFEGGLIQDNQVESIFTIDREVLEANLSERIIDLNMSAEDPLITWNSYDEKFDISAEQIGWNADIENLIEQLNEQIAELNNLRLTLSTTPLYPLVTAEELEAVQTPLIDKLTTPTWIFTDKDEWEMIWTDNLHLLNFEPVKSVEINGETIQLSLDADESFEGKDGLVFKTDVKVAINDALMMEHIEKYIAPEMGVQAENVEIVMDENGRITFEGTATDGIEIEYENLSTLLEIALNEGLNEVEIPVHITKGEVNVPVELQELGINELVGVGYSNFYGSTYNRKHNIAVAMNRYDGVLVAPGADFSFGEQLGPVDGSTGYKKELVIKEGLTIPEYGGGVCQVSSTLFRAVLNSGFPIVERHPHSYAVGYYAYGDEWGDGWGLDATVYPPQVDMQFTNDSEHYILIESYTYGTMAYFKMYGTKDGREVNMEGPFISNRQAAPPPVYTVTSDLEAGVIEKKDSAHNGFTATWTRTVTYPVGHYLYPEGHEVVETITSPYKPWAAKYWVGEGTEGYE
jgi:vancomycin resistance protein YoaR